MIIDQALIAGILAKSFPKGEMIRHGRGGHIEFDILVARVAYDLNKCQILHNQVCQITADIAKLHLEKSKLVAKCDHFAKKLTRDEEEGTETIFCHICGTVFLEGVVNDC